MQHKHMISSETANTFCSSQHESKIILIISKFENYSKIFLLFYYVLYNRISIIITVLITIELHI